MSELGRQGRLGIVNLVLAILAFFDLTAGGLLAHISGDLRLTVIGVLFLLSTIITFISRRQISSLDDKISVVERQSKDAELRAIKAKDNADKKINEMRIQFEKEKNELITLCEKLNVGLESVNNELQRRRMQDLEPSHFTSPSVFETKKVEYQADTILDITTPEEILYNEADEILKKHKNR